MGYSKDIPQDAPGPAVAARAQLIARLQGLSQDLRGGGTGLGRVLAQSLDAQGKCFRGTLMILTGDVLGTQGPARDAVLEAAMACEMVHTASLLIDDLPSMDNADLRRGTPAFHVSHGEATTILAGIALVAEAVGIVARAPGPAVQQAGMAALLTRAVGTAGLCEGQMRDLSPGKSAAGVEQEHDLKTGALFVCGFEMVALAANVGPERQAALAALGLPLGRCFQCLDDLSDALGTEASTGKSVGRDADGGSGGAGGGSSARGQLAVRSVEAAVALFHHLRADLDRSLSDCGLTATAVDDYIAQVLPRGLDGIAAAAGSGAGVAPATAGTGRNAASA